jgi:hypothetical protein
MLQGSVNYGKIEGEKLNYATSQNLAPSTGDWLVVETG